MTIDSGKAPWGKGLADVDGDGFLDVVVGGGYVLNGSVYWYKYPTWEKYLIGTVGGGNDLQIADINNDGALDVVVNKSIYWYENPRGLNGNVFGTWTGRSIHSWSGHDLLIANVNGDAKLDVLSRREFSTTQLYLQNTPTSWTRVHLANAPNGEGSAIGDINGDGRVDVVGNGYWLKQPANALTDPWPRYDFATWPEAASAELADFNNDGRLDVVLAASEVGIGTLSWFEAPADPETGNWVKHDVDIVEDVHRIHVKDMNKDGSLDIVFAEMHQSDTGDRVGIYYNKGGGLSWVLQVLSTQGSHNIAVADVEGDGDLDILGANWQISASDGGAIKLWRNDLTP